MKPRIRWRAGAGRPRSRHHRHRDRPLTPNPRAGTGFHARRPHVAAARGCRGDRLHVSGGVATFESHAEIFSIREVMGEDNEAVPGSPLPLVPARTATLGGDLRLPARFDLMTSARYTGARWLRGDEANKTEPLAESWVADAKVGYTRGAWSVDAVVNNLFDREFATFGTFNINQSGGGVLDRFLTPSEPRAVHLTPRRSFGAMPARD